MNQLFWFSPKMLQVLRDVVEGRGTHFNCHGLSEHGGRARILCALQRRGVMTRNYKATKAGKKLVRHLRRSGNENRRR